MRLRLFIFAGIFISTILFTLNSFTVKTALLVDDAEGRALFVRHCTVCHLAADPASLTKEIWKNHVLPVMAARMGLIYPGYDPLRGLSEEERAIVDKNHIIPDQPVITDENWTKLVNYIMKNAPDSVSRDEKRLSRNAPLKQFAREDIQVDRTSPSLITSLKYNTEAKTLWIGNFYNKVFTWKYDTGVTQTIETASPAVDFNFEKDRTYFTKIGKLYPTELSTGLYAAFENNSVQPIITDLHRPVHSEIKDLNNDGILEIVVCNFGNKTGSLSLYKKNKSGKYTEQFFYPIYGVTKVLAEDFDQDGDIDFAATAFFPDFGKLVDESFVYLENINQSKFAFKSYIQKGKVPIKTLSLEKADIDGDGDMDIITGNFAQSPGPVPEALDKSWKSAKYGLSIFVNQLHQPKK